MQSQKQSLVACLIVLHFKEAGQSSCWVHFPALNMSLSGETLSGKMQFLFFSWFPVVMSKQKVYKNGALGHQ